MALDMDKLNAFLGRFTPVSLSNCVGTGRGLREGRFHDSDGESISKVPVLRIRLPR
jgi:hypothetical protein